MKLGFFYAGQGAQYPGMGRDFYEREPSFRAVFDGAALDFDLRETAFSDPKHQLDATRFTQPCMTAFAAGVTEVLAHRGVAPACAAGQSLGEYAALYAARAFTLAEVLRAVNFRGKAMAAAADGADFALCAVLGADEAEVAAACRAASAAGTAAIAGYNCPGQIVLGGHRTAVECAAERLGRSRCRMLRTSGPFHTPLLRPAGDALEGYFAAHPPKNPAIPVLFNVRGGEMLPGDTVAALLARQVWQPVRLEESIRAMAAKTDAVIAVGPGHAVAGFFRRTVPDFPCFPLETVGDLDKLAAFLHRVGK